MYKFIDRSEIYMEISEMEENGSIDNYLELKNFIRQFIDNNYPLSQEDLRSIIEDRPTENVLKRRQTYDILKEAIENIIEVAAYKQDGGYLAWLEEKQAELGSRLQQLCWNEDRFIRGFTEEGQTIGQRTDPEASMWLNPQSWSVISGMGNNAKTAMDNVKKYLDTELGIKKIEPSMKDYPSKEDPLTYYNKGCGENGSVFCHANTWAIIAECMLKRPENAYKYPYLAHLLQNHVHHV